MDLSSIIDMITSLFTDFDFDSIIAIITDIIGSLFG